MTGAGNSSTAQSEEGRPGSGLKAPSRDQQVPPSGYQVRFLPLTQSHCQPVLHLGHHQGLLAFKHTGLSLGPQDILRETARLGGANAPLNPLGARRAPVILYYSRPVNGHGGGDQTSPRQRECGSSNPLYLHGFCQWPGCEQVFKEYEAFLKHLDDDHCLTDTSRAQCFLQKARVRQLEQKLVLETERLLAMQSQLGAKESLAHVLDVPGKDSVSVCPEYPRAPGGPSLSSSASGHIPTPSTHRDGENRSCVFSDVNPTLEYYRIYNVRPPLTYAALIRWAILETPDRQLTLNEIYQWFTHTFAFFRYNTATWKNAVRHNLSLHKCFVRVENVKGSVWTVDELEFERRRGQRVSRALGQDGTGRKVIPRTPR
ncbi:forkhead box protein P3-like isoform X2 [Hemiscyllium ocellatum]|uniref:forkhead box protein P3-like isoform X2 n=1 Tax=Hemiscyllium ocellatum TaxID=170820 RepID=UPI002967013F|nr:forkhead box protein P3-like isoform X2 [Hemiscyllium ocellatum]